MNHRSALMPWKTLVSAIVGLSLLTFACTGRDRDEGGGSEGQESEANDELAAEPGANAPNDDVSNDEEGPPELLAANIVSTLLAAGYRQQEDAEPLGIATPPGTDRQTLRFEHPDDGVASVHLFVYPNDRFVEAPYSDMLHRARRLERPVAALRSDERLVVVEAFDRSRAQRLVEVLAERFGLQVEENMERDDESATQ